ncbi:MAG: AtpZ/AtpI family protein [Spirochaetota bacterium]
MKDTKRGYQARFLKRIDAAGGGGTHSGNTDNLLWLRTAGLIGWSVIVPPLLGIALGSWLDASFPAKFPFALTLMLTGFALGCCNAWRHMKRVVEKKDGK